MLLDGSCWQYMLPKSPRNKQPPSASSDTYRHLLSSFRSYAGPAIPQHSVTLEMLLRHEVPTLMSAPDHLELALNARLHSLSRTRGTATSGIHFGVPLKKPPKNAGSRASHLPACCRVFWSWNRWGTLRLGCSERENVGVSEQPGLFNLLVCTSTDLKLL